MQSFDGISSRISSSLGHENWSAAAATSDRKNVKIAGTFAALMTIIFGLSLFGSSREGQVPMGPSAAASVVITAGTIFNKTPYYHCDPIGHDPKLASHAESARHHRHVVLLHGAKFTREDWSTSGIMHQLCQVEGLSVTALDLPINSGHVALQTLLHSMRSNKIVKPPIILVTPSKSSKTMVDWFLNGNVHDIPKFVDTWVPIGPNIINDLDSKDDAKISLLKDEEDLKILAMYGSRDLQGKYSTNRLEELAGAQVVEIPGGHPCYLDSPNEFVKEFLTFVGMWDPKKKLAFLGN